jgi:hypothetical protein
LQSRRRPIVIEPGIPKPLVLWEKTAAISMMAVGLTQYHDMTAGFKRADDGATVAVQGAR